jgi:hypothetical protein
MTAWLASVVELAGPAAADEVTCGLRALAAGLSAARQAVAR